MKVALDTNILAYAAGADDVARQERAAEVLDSLEHTSLVIPAQVAGELYNVLSRKAGFGRSEALRVVAAWTNLIGLRIADAATFQQAFDLAARHRLQIWDALILSTASEAGCGLLLSEDMQDGFVYRGVTVADPFAETLHPLLASVLTSFPEDPR